MKTLIASAVLAASLALASAASAGDLTVQLTGAHAGGGKIHGTLSTQDTFMRAGGRTATAESAAGTVTLTFSDLPPGDYAFMAYHDENGDGRMGRSPTGMPSEGWAMVNGARLMGPPTFEILKFTVPAEGATVQAPLVYGSGQ